MAVEKETFKADDLVWNKTKCEPVTIHRGFNGKWHAVIVTDLEVDLGDGRIVRFAGEIEISGRQSGKRPYRMAKARAK